MHNTVYMYILYFKCIFYNKSEIYFHEFSQNFCVLLQITRSEKVSVKDTMEKPDGMKAIKKPESLKDKARTASAIEKPEPIQLPPSFSKVTMVSKKLN